MMLDPALAPLAAWFAGFQRQTVDIVGGAVDAVCIDGLRRLRALLAAVHAAGGGEQRPEHLAWRTALEHEIRPITRAVQAAIAEAEARFTGHTATAPLREQLAATLATLPLQCTLEPAPSPTDTLSTRHDHAPAPELPLRGWFEHTLGAPLQELLGALDDGLSAALRRSHAELARIETVLDYHLFIVDESRELASRDDSARTGLDHAIRLIQAQEAAIDRRRDGILRAFIAESSARMDDALAPLRARRPEEILRALALRDAQLNPGPLHRWARRARDGLHELESRARPLVRELLAELDPSAPHLGHWDLVLQERRVHGGGAPLPELYRRLFGDIPLGVSDLYQPRPHLEEPIRAAFQAWVDGQRASLLVVGDRGAGKRTLVNRVRAELRADLPVHWIALGPHLADEDKLAAALAELLDVPAARRLHDLVPAQRSRVRRQVIILERLEFAFRRTPAGTQALHGLTELIRATDGAVFWIALLSQPSLALLDAAVELSRRFSRVVQLDPAPPAFIEQVLRSRHRASGFGLRFEVPLRQPLQRLRRRLQRADHGVEPGQEWFSELAAVADGNIFQALQYWQLAASLDPRTRHDILLQPLPSRRGAALAELTLEQRLVLAALVQHGALASGALSEVLLRPPHQTLPELDDLRRRGLVQESWAGALEVKAPAWLPITTDLRARNIL